VLALAVTALAGPALARADSGVTPTPHAGTRGVYLVPGAQGQSATIAAPRAAATSSDRPLPLVDHGGPVFDTTNTVQAVYWFPSGYPLNSSWRSIVDGYLGNVAADSGKTSNVYSDTEEYGVDYNATFAGSAVDTTPFPASGCHVALQGSSLHTNPCLTEAQIDDELVSFAHSQGWAGDTDPAHPTKLFIVYLPSGVVDCFDNSEGICSANSADSYYCAYHTSVESGGETFVWANMPWSWDDTGCGGTSYPNSKNGDKAITVTSHEYIEAITDPFLNAWFDNSFQGLEVADKCQETYGSSVDTTAPGYNQLIHGGHYWTQLEYSNELSGCYQVGEPIISSLTPASAPAGQAVRIHGENFFGALTVKFAGVPATVISSSPTTITARVPVGGTYGKMTVRAIGGTAVSPENFGFGAQISGVDPLDGEVGTPVTITGAGMTDVTVVKFGSVSVPFDIQDDGTITTAVPAGFSSGKLTVSNDGGHATSSQTFQLTKITALTPLAAKAGSTLTITGQGLRSTTTVDFPGHTGGVAVTGASTSTVKVVVPNDATFGPLTVHTPNIDPGGLSTKVFKATPTIAAFTRDGKVGGTVTITGANIGDATSVKFGTVASGTVGITDATTITAVVPGSFSTGVITVVTPHGTVVTTSSFQVTKVSGLSRLSGGAGTIVTITGQGLKSATTVDFAAALAAPVLTTSSSAITVKIPSGAAIGSLTVHTPNIDAAGIATAKQLSPLPRITGFDASNYQAGDLVTVHGTNLVETGAYTAAFGGVSVGVSVSDAQTLTFTLPASATTGSLTFANAAGSTTSMVHVHVRPTISGWTAGHAVTGAKVTLDGATFKGTTAVTFGGAKASTFTVGAGGASLTVTVPSSAVDGPIAVTNAGGTTASDTAFLVDPLLTGYSPASGTVGSTVTITGTGLEHVTRVDFGGDVSAPPTSTAARSLAVVVPVGATSGPIAVHASAADATGPTFSITFSVTSFSQPFAAPGASITVNGVGLSSVSTVKFGTSTATITQKTGTALTVTVPAISGDSTVSVTKGTTTIEAPAQFGLFSVTSASPSALAPGGTLTVAGSNVDGATVTFAGVGDPVTLSDAGTATVPDGFTGSTVTIADVYGDSIDKTVALFGISSYDASHAGPGDTISISLSDGDYSASTVHVKFAGVAAVTGTGGDGSVSVVVPAGATSGALQVEAGASGWATGGSFTVDRASVAIDEVAPGQLKLLVTGAGGVGDTTVSWRQGGTTHTIALDPRNVQVDDLITVPAGFELGELTVEVATPLGAEDGIALNDGGTPSDGFQSDVAALQADGVWGGPDSFDWSALTDGQSVGRVDDATPDDAGNWAIGASS
jgi:hypothetical protein